MRHRRGEPRLAVEQLARLVGLGDLVRDDLERERARQVGVLDLVDLAHPALADPRQDLVAAADQRRVLGGLDPDVRAARRRRAAWPGSRATAVGAGRRAGAGPLRRGAASRRAAPAAGTGSARAPDSEVRGPATARAGSTRTSLDSSWSVDLGQPRQLGGDVGGRRRGGAGRGGVGARRRRGLVRVRRRRQRQDRRSPARWIALIRHRPNRTRVESQRRCTSCGRARATSRTCCRCRSRSRRRRC